MSKKIKEFEIPKGNLKKIVNRDWVKKQLIAGKKIQDILELPDSTMDKFYLAACQLFENKSYHDAADAFLFLVTVNPYHYDYWIGLGASTQHCNEYEAAIDAYEMAAICQLDNPIPYFHLANCLFAMHDRESALQAIELVLEYSEDNDSYDELRHKAHAAKAVLEKES